MLGHGSVVLSLYKFNGKDPGSYYEWRRKSLRNCQDYLAELFGVFQIVVGGGAFVEGPNLVDGRAEAALSDKLEDGAEFALGAHVGAEDGKLAGKEEPDVEFGVVSGGGAAGNQAAAGSEAFEAVIPSGGTDMFDDDVDAVIVGETTHFLGDRHDEVVDDFIGAQFTGFGEFFVGAGSCDNARAEELGDLDRGAANTAASSENQNGFAGLELSAVDEHVPRGEEDKRNRSGVSPIEVFRIREAIDLGHTNIFRAATINHVTEVGEVAAAVILTGKTGRTFATGYAGRENDFLADVNGGDFRADLDDFAGNIAAGNVGKRDGNAGEAAANPKVKVIEGASVDADEDFVVTEGGFGDVGIAKDGRVTVFVDNDGFHGQPPGSARLAMAAAYIS
jgi:hypothetical protein